MLKSPFIEDFLAPALASELELLGIPLAELIRPVAQDQQVALS